MKFTVAATTAALLGAVSAAPAAVARDSNQNFGLISARSGSPIHLQPVNAAGTRFWLGKDTSSYCPESVVTDCPAGNSTLFAGGNDTLSLAVEVPGGQQVYVAADGALGYTVAHSAAIPAGATTTGFTRTEPADGQSFGTLSWKGGLVACPDASASGVYQVYGQVDGFSRTDCLGFDALATTVDEAYGAWQYA